MTHRRSFLWAVTTLGVALGMSLVLAACTSVASPQPAASGAVAGVTASASSADASGASPGASATSSAASSASPSGTMTLQGAAEASACSAFQSLGDEMRALAALDPAVASKDDVSAQVEKVRVAWFDVKSSLQAVNQADDTALREAGRGLETAIDDFATDVPLTEAMGTVRAAAEPVRVAYKNMADGLGCTLTNPY
jgi:hypothetical protein